MFMKKKKREKMWILLVAFAVMLAMSVTANAATKKRVSITAKNQTITIGTKKKSLGVKATKGAKVRYKSSAPSVVRVSSAGKVTAKKAGSAKITIKATKKGYKSASVTIKVKVKKKKQTIIASGISMDVGAKKSLGATAKTSLSYSSSNTAVATVSSKGVVRGKKAGTAYIKIKAKATATYASASRKIKVTVKEKQTTPTPALKYTYTVKFLKQPYSGKSSSNSYMLSSMVIPMYIQTDNPNPSLYDIVFYDESGKSVGTRVYCYYDDVSLEDDLVTQGGYKVAGGYLQLKSITDEYEGPVTVAIREFCPDCYNMTEKKIGTVQVKSAARADKEWMQKVINSVTNSSMTKPEKMKAIVGFLQKNAKYPANYTNGEGKMSLLYSIMETIQPLSCKFPLVLDSCTSPYWLVEFGEMIDYPMVSLFSKYERGTTEWNQYHFCAQSVEDGTLYECCPSAKTGFINISSRDQYPKINFLTYNYFCVLTS